MQEAALTSAILRSCVGFRAISHIPGFGTTRTKPLHETRTPAAYAVYTFYGAINLWVARLFYALWVMTMRSAWAVTSCTVGDLRTQYGNAGMVAGLWMTAAGLALVHSLASKLELPVTRVRCRTLVVTCACKNLVLPTLKGCSMRM